MAVRADRRGLWGRWLVDQRASHGRLTQKAVRDMLAKMGHSISEAYYGDFERGKTTPSPEWQDVFHRLWGSLPEPEAEPEPAQTPDLSALIAQLAAQTEAMKELTVELRRATATQDQGFETLAGLAGTVASLLDRVGTQGASVPEGNGGGR